MIKQALTIAFLTLSGSILTGCSNSSEQNDAPLTIGSLGPGGGVVFEFLDDSNKLGLEVFPSDIGRTSWGCLGVNVDSNNAAQPPNGVDVPAGVISSELLREVNESGICFADAAQLAFDFSNNDFNDWYLPSTDELMDIRELGLLPGLPGDAYWSATEDTDQNAYTVLIRVEANPLDTGEPSTSEKGSVAFVIPIRTFLIE